MFAPQPLPFDPADLVPKGFSKETIEFHFGKHHSGYAKRLNELSHSHPEFHLQKHNGNALSVILGTKPDTVVFNLAAQLFNHDFYWNSLSPNGGALPEHSESPLRTKIVKDFGSYKNFHQTFTNIAVGHFGSGWVWLVYNMALHRLEVMETHDAGCPVAVNGGSHYLPIFVCDVWEHAYYIDHRSDRPGYVKAFWRALNWKFAEQNFKKALILSHNNSKL